MSVVVCTDGHTIDEPSAYTATRSFFACSACSWTDWRGAASIEESPDERDTTHDFYSPRYAVNDGERLTPAHVWFGADHSARRRRSRLMAQEHFARAVLRIDRPRVMDTSLSIPVRMLELVQGQARVFSNECSAGLSAARKVVEAMDPSEQPWHRDSLAGIDPWFFWAMRDGRNNPVRDFLAQGGWTIVDLPSGNPRGPKPRQLTDDTRCEITDWLERSLEKPIETIREYIGKGKKSPFRDALAELVRRSSTKQSASDIADVLGVHRNTVTRWRNGAQSPIRGKAFPPRARNTLSPTLNVGSNS